MAKKTNKTKRYVVTVKGNPDFCGKGAGGVQFANGKAVNVTARMAAWFKEHEGYVVEEIEEADAPDTPDAGENAD